MLVGKKVGVHCLRNLAVGSQLLLQGLPSNPGQSESTDEVTRRSLLAFSKCCFVRVMEIGIRMDGETERDRSGDTVRTLPKEVCLRGRPDFSSAFGPV